MKEQQEWMAVGAVGKPLSQGGAEEEERHPRVDTVLAIVRAHTRWLLLKYLVLGWHLC